jgi:hypothetical protein
MPKPPLRTLQSANRLGGQVCVGHAKAASGLQCVFEAHRGVPPIQYYRGIRQRFALQAPQSGVAVAQHRRRRVCVHADHCERLVERAGYNRGAVARESEAGLAALSADHLPGDHFKMPLVFPMPAGICYLFVTATDRICFRRKPPANDRQPRRLEPHKPPMATSSVPALRCATSTFHEGRESYAHPPGNYVA